MKIFLTLAGAVGLYLTGVFQAEVGHVATAIMAVLSATSVALGSAHE